MIRVLASQVPSVWEVIKFVVKQSGNYEDKVFGDFLNDLLYDLLNGKAQCIVNLNNDRQIRVLYLLSIVNRQYTKVRALHISGIYAWEQLSDEDWIKMVENVIAIAKEQECKYVTLNTNIDKIKYIALSYGCVEEHSALSLAL